MRKGDVLTSKISFDTGWWLEFDLRSHQRPSLSKIGLGTTERKVVNIDNKHEVELGMFEDTLPIRTLFKPNGS